MKGERKQFRIVIRFAVLIVFPKEFLPKPIIQTTLFIFGKTTVIAAVFRACLKFFFENDYCVFSSEKRRILQT